MYACKKKLSLLLSLFPLYKNGSGLIDIMHIEVEKKLHQVKLLNRGDIWSCKKKRWMSLQLNHKTTYLQMKLPNGQSTQEIGFHNIIEKVTGGDCPP